MSARRTTAEVLQDRLKVTLALGEAHAARHRAQARAGGSQIEMMHYDETDVSDGDGAAAQVRNDAAQTRLAEAEAAVAALVRQLAVLDAELAATDAATDKETPC